MRGKLKDRQAIIFIDVQFYNSRKFKTQGLLANIKKNFQDVHKNQGENINNLLRVFGLKTVLIKMSKTMELILQKFTPKLAINYHSLEIEVEMLFLKERPTYAAFIYA